MKVKLKQYRHKDQKSLDQFLKTDLGKNMQEITTALDKNLKFDDQFNSFLKEVTVAAKTEARIRNQLDVIPTEWNVVDTTGEKGRITRSTTKWTQDYLYLYNDNDEEVTFKVRFFEGDATPVTPPTTNNSRKLSHTMFTESSGSTLPTSWSTVDLSGTTRVAEGDGVTVTGSDVITFPFTGVYTVWITVGDLDNNTSTAKVSLRMRNTTDNTTLDAAVAGTATAEGSSYTFLLRFEITDLTKDYELQVCASAANTTIEAATIDSEACPAYRVIFERMSK